MKLIASFTQIARIDPHLVVLLVAGRFRRCSVLGVPAVSAVVPSCLAIQPGALSSSVHLFCLFMLTCRCSPDQLGKQGGADQVAAPRPVQQWRAHRHRACSMGQNKQQDAQRGIVSMLSGRSTTSAWVLSMCGACTDGAFLD